VLGLTAALALTVAACGSSDEGASGTGKDGSVTVRLGYFPNLTHGTALVGVARGTFAKALGTDELETSTFKDGTEAVEALNADAIDATYIGTGPAINLFQKSTGDAIRIVSGATSGGASFVVSKDIDSAADLKGKTVASPKLGNTQDVSLRAWLADQGLETTTSGGGDVKIVPQENAQTLDAFKAGDIAGAWLPEPWASRLVLEGGGKVLVDERDLYPGGQFATTILIVKRSFLDAHPQTVKRLLQGQVEANTWINAHPDEAKQIVNDSIEEITGKSLPAEVIDRAWDQLSFTDDPLVGAAKKAATDAEDLGFIDSDDISGAYALDALNAILKAAGADPVTTP
jgi:NitT/TauT family transport system substrate-binding protein